MPKLLKEYRIKFERIPKGRKAVPDSRKLGIRSKLGGKPDWEQGAAIPKCPYCKKSMSFIAQIDSMEHDEIHNQHRIDSVEGEQEFMFGDVGLIYVFFCFDCLATLSVFQCT